MEYQCISCGELVQDKYEFEIHRYMCQSCWNFYVNNNPEEEEN
ncbi:MAG: hypothetical protein ACRCU6_05675 [Fusobacteriaceae bacterium]